MRIAVVREVIPAEARVAVVPESIKKLVGWQAEALVESGAGTSAGATDDDYVAAGAKIVRDRAALLADADILVSIHRPPTEDLQRLKPGAVLIGLLKPLDEPAALQPVVNARLTAFALELVPRTTRAQAMDVLSSMAMVAGYKAVLLGAGQLPKMFPLLMTAAGTVPPAKVLVLGAGVAGLQAIATARRLGAVLEAYDIRAASGEQVKSLGAKFLAVDLTGIETQDEGGYAKEISEEAQQRGRDLIAEHAAKSDLIITTAQVPGRPAPRLLTAEAVAGMKPGSVIVDMAGSSGGNCELSRPGETVTHHGVTILAPLNLAATVPVHASQLYSRNIASFLGLLIRDGALNIDLGDEILKASCIVQEGTALHPRVAAACSQATVG